MRSATTTSTGTARHVRRGLVLLALVLAAMLGGPGASALAAGPVASVTGTVPVAGQVAAPVADTADRVVHDVQGTVPQPVRHAARASANQGTATVGQTTAAATAPAAAAVAATRVAVTPPVAPRAQRAVEASSISHPAATARPAHHRAHTAAAPRSRSSLAARHSAGGRTPAAAHHSTPAPTRAAHAGTAGHPAPAAHDALPSHPAPAGATSPAGASAGSGSGTGIALVAALAGFGLLLLAPRRRGARLRLPSATWTPTVLLLSIERPD